MHLPFAGAPSRDVSAAPGLGDNAFEANATGVLVHLTAVDLKVFNGRFSDQLFRCDSNGMREKTGPVAIGKVFSARGLAKVLRSTPGLQRGP